MADPPFRGRARPTPSKGITGRYAAKASGPGHQAFISGAAHGQGADEAFGGIHNLFNSAGIRAFGLAHELTEAAWDSMIDINLKGPRLVARRVIPVMIRRKTGVIINNSSVGGLRGMGRLGHYAASKWGLTGLTRSWAIELAPHNVRVVSIHPTGVNTPMNDGLAELEGLTPKEIAERSAGNLLPVPLDRAGGCGPGGGLSRAGRGALRHRLAVHY